MTKAELIEAMADGADISKAAAGKALDAFTTTIGKSLKKGNKVTLVGRRITDKICFIGISYVHRSAIGFRKHCYRSNFILST